MGYYGPSDKYVVTSPNMDYIPEIVYSNIEVFRRGDGHFGLHDPIRWPQMFAGPFRHYVAIPRKPVDSYDRRMPMWTPLRRSDVIETEHTLIRSFITISRPFIARLRPLVDDMIHQVREFRRKYLNQTSIDTLVTTMQQAFQRLGIPSMERDLILQVATVQHYWMLSTAWLDYHVNLLGDCPFAPLQ